MRLEVFIAHILAWGDAHIATGVERPALRLDLGDRRRLAEAGDVGIGGLLAEGLLQLYQHLLTAHRQIRRFAAIKPHDIGDEADLRRRPVAVGAVHLAIDVAGIDKEHGIGALRLRLPAVEEPEGARQRDGVEHVRADGDHHIHCACLDQLLAQFLFAAAGVRGGVGHDEASAAPGIERRIEELNPEVVGVVGAWQTEGKAATHSDHVLEPLFVDSVDVEGGIGQHEVELTCGRVWIVVVTIDIAAVADVAFEAVYGKVETGEAAGLVGLLDATDGEFSSGVLVVFGHEACRLDEHSARAAGGIEDATVKGFDHLRKQFDDAGRRVELAATLPFAHGELTEEVFVDAAEGVEVERGRDLGDLLEQLLEQGAGE